jgi:hypothetical protein
MCPKVEGVNMEPFKPSGLAPEDEILPLCPAIFTVIVAMKNGSKVTVALEQQPHAAHAYLPPVKKT